MEGMRRRHHTHTDKALLQRAFVSTEAQLMIAMPQRISGAMTRLMLVISFCSVRTIAAADDTPIVGNVERLDSVRMALPPEVFATVGIECNIYFDNVVLMLNPANFSIDVKCAKGRQQSERWTWT